MKPVFWYWILRRLPKSFYVPMVVLSVIYFGFLFPILVLHGVPVAEKYVATLVPNYTIPFRAFLGIEPSYSLVGGIVSTVLIFAITMLGLLMSYGLAVMIHRVLGLRFRLKLQEDADNSEPPDDSLDVTLSDFDVFLCHNSADKPTVKLIGEELKRNGILPWLDEWNLISGRSWQRALEEQIGKIGSVAVFVGDSGLGPWTHMEVEAFLREFVQRGCPVIPIILPDAKEVPELPVFLRGMHWVDFRKRTPDPLDQLMWGITGQKPRTPTKKRRRQKGPQ